MMPSEEQQLLQFGEFLKELPKETLYTKKLFKIEVITSNYKAILNSKSVSIKDKISLGKKLLEALKNEKQILEAEMIKDKPYIKQEIKLSTKYKTKITTLIHKLITYINYLKEQKKFIKLNIKLKKFIEISKTLDVNEFFDKCSIEFYNVKQEIQENFNINSTSNEMIIILENILNKIKFERLNKEMQLLSESYLLSQKLLEEYQFILNNSSTLPPTNNSTLSTFIEDLKNFFWDFQSNFIDKQDATEANQTQNVKNDNLFNLASNFMTVLYYIEDVSSDNRLLEIKPLNLIGDYTKNYNITNINKAIDFIKNEIPNLHAQLNNPKLTYKDKGKILNQLEQQIQLYKPQT